MLFKRIESLDAIELVMAIEEVFDVAIPDEPPKNFDEPGEFIDWLEPRVSNQRPNGEARRLLTKLAKDLALPDLAEGLEGTWRREQIDAVVREFFHRLSE